MVYELYSYCCVDNACVYDYVFSFKSFDKMKKYMDTNKATEWIFVDNSGRSYAEFGFSEKELKNLLLLCKERKYIKKFKKNGKTARKKAEKECDKLCARVVKIKEKINRREKVENMLGY